MALAWAAAPASAQVADAAPGTDPPALTPTAADPDCGADCDADEAPAEDDATDDGSPSDEADAPDADDPADDEADVPPPPGTLDAALLDGVVHGGDFAAPRAGRLRAVLVAAPGTTGPSLGRLTTRVARPAHVALDLRLTASGESVLADAEDAVTLVVRTTWTARRSTRPRTAERRIVLPLAP